MDGALLGCLVNNRDGGYQGGLGLFWRILPNSSSDVPYDAFHPCTT